MIRLNQSDIHRSREIRMATGEVIPAEGLGLVRSSEVVGGEFSARVPVSPANTDIFMGLSLATYITLSSFPVVENVKVTDNTAGQAIAVLIAPPQGSGATKLVAVYDENDVKLTTQVATIALVDAATKYAVENGVVAVHDTLADTTVKVVYSRALTLQESRNIMGDEIPGGVAANAYGSVGIIQEGRIHTSQFDVTADWANATVIKIGANGQVISGGTGATIPNAKVIALPSTDSPYLGIEF